MGGSIGEHVWRQSYKMSTSQVTFGANLIKCQLLMSTSTVVLARILQSVNFSIYRYILGNTNTGVCSDIGNTNTSIHPVSYCPIWDEAVLIPLCGLSLGYHALSLSDQTLFSLPSAHPLRSDMCRMYCRIRTRLFLHRTARTDNPAGLSVRTVRCKNSAMVVHFIRNKR